MSEELALACLDPDSPANARTPTFDLGAKDVLDLDNDTIVMLWERQKMWQEECSPSVRTKSTKDLYKLAKEVSEGDDPFPYAALSPLTRFQLQHFTACLLAASPDFKSQFSRLFGGSSSSDSSAATTTTPTQS
jgi:hypothetical protein